MAAEPPKQLKAQNPRPYSLTTDSPKFEVIDLAVNKNQIVSHESFLLSATIKNAGSVGSYALIINDNEKNIHKQWILLEDGEEKTYEIPLRLYDGGKHQIALNDATVSINVEGLKLAPEKALIYSAPEIDPLIHKNDSLTFSYTVKNISGFAMEGIPEIYIDYRQAANLPTICLEPGELSNLTHTLPPLSDKGFHSISVSNGPGTRFKTYEDANETLVLHYDFQKINNQIKDHSGFDNHGNIIGDIEFIEGINGPGVQITNGYIDISPSPSLDIHENEMTIVCRYKVGDEKGMGSIITQGTHNIVKMSGKWQVKLAIGGWGRGQCHYNTPPKQGENQSPGWLNDWIEVAGVRQAGNLQLYVDGKLRSQLFPRGKIYATPFHWRIGDNAEHSGERRPEGIIDEVWIFAGALSEQQIRQVSH